MRTSNKKNLTQLIEKFLDGAASRIEFQKVFTFFLNHQKIKKWSKEFESEKKVEDRMCAKIQSELMIGSYSGKTGDAVC